MQNTYFKSEPRLGTCAYRRVRVVIHRHHWKKVEREDAWKRPRYGNKAREHGTRTGRLWSPHSPQYKIPMRIDTSEDSDGPFDDFWPERFECSET